MKKIFLSIILLINVITALAQTIPAANIIR